MITIELVILGAIAGFTIFLGLPVAMMTRVTPRVKGFLNAITIGVLIFIFIEVLPSAKQLAENAVISEGAGGLVYVVVLILGFALGVFSLVAYETRFIRIKRKASLDTLFPANKNPLPQGLSGKQDSSKKQETRSIGIGEVEASGQVSQITQVLQDPRALAFSIAVGIGVHNFSEGLAIGQSFASSVVRLSFFLAIGFAIHNATEGFGIAAPMAGYKPSISYLALLGFIGGFPTLLGTLLGGVYPASPLALTFFLALAGGALVYVISGMFYVARRQTSNQLFMLGLFVGFLLAYGTDLWLAMLQV